MIFFFKKVGDWTLIAKIKLINNGCICLVYMLSFLFYSLK